MTQRLKQAGTTVHEAPQRLWRKEQPEGGKVRRRNDL